MKGRKWLGFLLLALALGVLGLKGSEAQRRGTSFVGGTSFTGAGPRMPAMGRLEVERIMARSNLSIEGGSGSLRTFAFGQRLPNRSQALILQGSLQVEVNGVPKQEGVHFLVDYQRKQLTFFEELDPQSVIRITYRWLRPEEVRQFTLGGISGIAGATQDDKKALATVSVQPVLAEGASFRLGEARLTLRQVAQAGTSSKPGEAPGPSLEARQIGLTLGEVPQGGRGTSVRVDWAMCRTMETAADPEMRRLARLLSVPETTLQPTRRYGGTRGSLEEEPSRDPNADVARTLALTHRSRSLSVEAQVQEIGKQFAAASALGYDPAKRGYRTEQLKAALALAPGGRSQVAFTRQALQGDAEGMKGGVSLEERQVTLGSLQYRRNELSISEDFNPNSNLAKQVVGEFQLASRKAGSAQAGLEQAPLTALKGVRDVQEQWQWNPSRNLQLARSLREITTSQGAALRESQSQATLLGGMVQIRQSEFEMSHDFALAPQVGYKHREAQKGHRLRDLVVQLQPSPTLGLTHEVHEVYANPSGQEGKGNITVTTQNALQWKLSPRTSLSLSQSSRTMGGEQARQAGQLEKLTTTEQRVVALQHQVDSKTQVSLRDVLTTTEKGEQSASQRQQVLGLKTSLGLAKVELQQDRRRTPEAKRWIRTDYTLSLGAIQAGYSEVAQTEQNHQTRLLLAYQRPLNARLTLSTRYLRVKNWTESDKAKETFRSLVGTEVALTFKPSSSLSLSVWQRTRNVEEDARYVDIGGQWEYRLRPGIAFRGQLQRIERDTQRHIGRKEFTLALAPSKATNLEAGYREESDPQGILRPTHFFKGTLQPWRGFSLSGHYTARDLGEEKGPTTKGYALVQKLGSGGEFKVEYLQNPLNEKGQVVPRTEESYSLVLPREWTGSRLSLKGTYKFLDDDTKGVASITGGGELTWSPSVRERLQLTYAQQYQYQRTLSGAQGTFTYTLRYSRDLGRDQQWGVSGQYTGYLGEGLRNRTGRRSDYRVETDFRIAF